MIQLFHEMPVKTAALEYAVGGDHGKYTYPFPSATALPSKDSTHETAAVMPWPGAVMGDEKALLVQGQHCDE
jgi:hypothetical protein